MFCSSEQTPAGTHWPFGGQSATVVQAMSWFSLGAMQRFMRHGPLAPHCALVVHDVGTPALGSGKNWIPRPMPADPWSCTNDVKAALTAVHFVELAVTSSSIDPEVSIMRYRSSGSCVAVCVSAAHAVNASGS